MPGSPNPEAIAWYVAKSEDFATELRAEVHALGLRGAQVAGFSGAVLALVGANAAALLDALDDLGRIFAGASLMVGSLLLIAALSIALRGSLLTRLTSAVSAAEVAGYASERFTHEPDLWRVQVRALHALLTAITGLTRRGDRAARAVEKAEYFFLSGLFSVGVAFATLIGVTTF